MKFDFSYVIHFRKQKALLTLCQASAATWRRARQRSDLQNLNLLFPAEIQTSKSGAKLTGVPLGGLGLVVVVLVEKRAGGGCGGTGNVK